mgnify:FL=1
MGYRKAVWWVQPPSRQQLVISGQPYAHDEDLNSQQPRYDEYVATYLGAPWQGMGLSDSAACIFLV